MSLLIKIFGFALMLVGLYYLGQNIIFTTRYSRYWYGDISATLSVLSIMAGVGLLVFGGRSASTLGWGLIGFGAVLVFASGGVMLRPTSLWTFFVAFTAFIGGAKLFSSGRV